MARWPETRRRPGPAARGRSARRDPTSPAHPAPIQPEARMRFFEGLDRRVDVASHVVFLERVERCPVRRRSNRRGEVFGGEPRVERRLLGGGRGARRRLDDGRDRDAGGGLGNGKRSGRLRRRRGRLSEKRVHLREELVGVERLGDDRIRADPLRAVPVERLESAGQKNDGDARRGRVSLDRLAHLVSVLLRHDGVGEDQVRADFANAIERSLSIRHAHELVIAVGERQLDHLLNGQAVVGQQDLLCHGISGGRSKSYTAPESLSMGRGGERVGSRGSGVRGRPGERDRDAAVSNDDAHKLPARSSSLPGIFQTADRYRPGSRRPRAPARARDAATTPWQKTPVSMPRPSSMYRRSSVATLPAAPGRVRAAAETAGRRVEDPHALPQPLGTFASAVPRVSWK